MITARAAAAMVAAMEGSARAAARMVVHAVEVAEAVGAAFPGAATWVTGVLTVAEVVEATRS